MSGRQAGPIARQAFDEGPWPRLPASERAKVLYRIADLIDKDADAIAYVECLDTGIPLGQIRTIGGEGGWGDRVPVDAGHATAARLVDSQGNTVATARLG